MSSACCSASPVAKAHLHHALGSGSTTVEPAHHARGATTGDRADLLVLGRIVTGVPSAPPAEAMAVSGGSIIGIGTKADMDALVGPSTQTISPDGVILPGLIDPHMHIWTSLLNLTWNELSHARYPKFDDVVGAIAAAAKQAAPGAWVLGRNFDPSLYPGEPVLTRDTMDKVAPDNPVLIMNASGHFFYANSKAFAAAGVTDDTPDPPGGIFGRTDGRLNGTIGEPPAMMVMLGPLPKPTSQDIAAGVNQILMAAARRGVTSVREAATGSIAGIGEYALLHQLNGAARLPVRVSTAQFSLAGGKSPAEAAADWAAAGVTPFSGDEMVRADAWKVITDGSNQGRSGYFMQPYLGEDTGGKADWTPEGLRDALRVGLDAGWQLMVHTNGDAAVEFALEAAEELFPGYAGTDLRHRFEHVSFTTDDQLTRMAAAGVSPSFLMNHVYFWGAAFRDTILGPERAGRLDRLASAYAAGLRPSIHSDYNVTEIDPLHSARTAVQRKLQADGSVLNPAECVTPEQALTAITTNAAWQIHADDRGTLEVGKRADFAVAADDPWSSDPESWPDIAIHATYIDGTPAFEG